MTKTIPKIENRQTLHKVDLEACQSILLWFVRCARRHRPAESLPWSEILVLLVDDANSASAHLAAFGDGSVTDVITMTYVPMPGMDVGVTGELVVNVQRAHKEGHKRIRHGWSPSHELALYIAHGVDHLTGATDAEPMERRRMRARELRWVRSAARKGYLDNLLK